MPALTKEQLGSHIVPVLLKSSKDPVPNVRLCVAKLLKGVIPKIDSAGVATKIKPRLTEMAADPDHDVQYYAKVALAAC